LSRPEDYAALAALLRERNAQTVVMYVATAPTLFTVVCEQLAKVNITNTTAVRLPFEHLCRGLAASNVRAR
jgi:glucose-6-phosphate 1-dehydrogenase